MSNNFIDRSLHASRPASRNELSAIRSVGFLLLLTICSVSLRAQACSAVQGTITYGGTTFATRYPLPVESQIPISEPLSATELSNRATFLSAGISVPKCACPASYEYWKFQATGQTGTGCTTVGGLQASVIQGVLLFSREAQIQGLTITGGKELGHDVSPNGFGHADGYKVDLQPIFEINAFVSHRFDSIYPRSNGDPQFGIAAFGGSGGVPDGPIFAWEKVSDPGLSGSHWDIVFPTNSITTVNTILGGSGTGIITSDFGFISCGVTCSAQFTRGLNLNLTALADSQLPTGTPSGSIFNSWSGLNVTTDLPSGAMATIYADLSPMDPPIRTITANFDPLSGGGGGPPPPPPPGSGPGSWVWDPTLNGGMGGWVWHGNPLPTNAAGPPPTGCWSWNSTIGGGAWIHQVCLPCAQIDLSNCIPGGGGTITTLTSGDPNEKAGLHGVGTAHYLSGSQKLSYGIFFDNEPTATAPAQAITVTDTLNGALVDLTTVTLGSISFVDKVVTAPSIPLSVLGTFSANVDLRPAKSLIISITASLNIATGSLTCTFTSLDPATGLLTTDPLAGVLPPGAEGSVSFTAAPKAPVTGTQISNTATVVFDVNQPINTPAWINTIDNSPPVSRVSALAATSTCPDFRVSWSGSDVGSGLQGFTIFGSDNGSPFTPWLSNTTAAAATYKGVPGHTYAFYSIATDLTGNLEVGKASGETSTAVAGSGICGPPSLSGQASGVTKTGTTVTVNLHLTNTGFTPAQAVNINQITFRTLSGSGTVTLATPALPAAEGPLDIGSSTTVILTLNVPTTVTRFSITEGGNLQDGAGNTYNYSIAQTVIP